MKKRTCVIIGVMLLAMASVCAMAQQSYPEDMLIVESPYFTTVHYDGAEPGICDFVTSLLNEEGMFFTDSGMFYDAWDHYLRHEQQEPESELVVDKKNGYVCQTYSYLEDFDGQVSDHKIFYETCYWNCADGKHKLFAATCNMMENGRYVEGQTTGIYFNLYENARHIMWFVNESLLGVDVDTGTDESYECDPETGLRLVKDRETGEPLALNEEDFYRWLEETPVVVYRLPKQGKDIIAEIHYATRTETIRLVWDGMMFHRE